MSSSCIQLYHILRTRGHCGFYTNTYTSGTSTIFSGLTSSLSSRFRMNLWKRYHIYLNNKQILPTKGKVFLCIFHLKILLHIVFVRLLRFSAPFVSGICLRRKRTKQLPPMPAVAMKRRNGCMEVKKKKKRYKDTFYETRLLRLVSRDRYEMVHDCKPSQWTTGSVAAWC